MPPLQPAIVPWNLNELMASLRDGWEDESLVAISGLQHLFQESEGDETLLVMAARKNLVSAVERMLRLGADPCYSVRNTMSAIETACFFGSIKTLEIILKIPLLNITSKEPLLSIVIKKWPKKWKKKSDHELCFRLLNNWPGIGDEVGDASESNDDRNN